MSDKYCFKNEFEEFVDGVPNFYLNDKYNGISEKFHRKILNYKSSKLKVLSNMKDECCSPDHTVYTGSAGIAMLYLLMASRKNDLNRELLMKALDYLELENLHGKRISFLCGDAGPLALAAVISFKLGHRRPENLPEYKTFIQRLKDLSCLIKQSPDEMLYGKSGYLYSLLFVNKHIGKDTISTDFIQKVVQSIITSGRKFSSEEKAESPLLWQWHDKVYLGAAHGVAGILYMLLQARNYLSSQDLRLYVKPTVDWVLGLKFPSGNYPSSLGSSSGDRLVQWCHGAPGFVPLCIQAAKVFGNPSYMKCAEECGDVVWNRGLCTKGYSLCHGVAGNAYAFLQLYQATKEPQQLYRACRFMEWCTEERPGSELLQPDRPASLFEGVSGRLYLLEDIDCLQDAEFPAFTL